MMLYRNCGAKRFVLLFFTLTFLTACQSDKQLNRVYPKAETEAVNSAGDAADDPALWVNWQDHEQSLVIGTQKKQGLYSYSLDGKIKQYLAVGRLNNVDLRQNVTINHRNIDLAAASNRSNNQISLFEINNQGFITPFIEVAVQPSNFDEVYGFCMGYVKQQLIFVVTGKDRDAELYQYNSQNNRIEILRTLELASQSEGCVIDDETGDIYIGEENTGIWQFNYFNQQLKIKLFSLPNPQAKADIEGLALFNYQAKKYLMFSSQGNDSFPIIELETNKIVTVIIIAENDLFDEVSGTDGIEVSQAINSKDYPQGIFIAQDDVNTKPKAFQNFKMISLAEVLKFIPQDR